MEEPIYSLKVNEDTEIELKKSTVDLLDIVPASDGTFHVLKDHTAYTVEVIHTDHSLKTCHLKVNGQSHYVKMEDQYDRLVKQLGLSTSSSSKINEVKAPMPGLVLEVAVEVGQEIKKGDGLLILEAMKMENVINSGGETA